MALSSMLSNVQGLGVPTRNWILALNPLKNARRGLVMVGGQYGESSLTMYDINRYSMLMKVVPGWTLPESGENYATLAIAWESEQAGLVLNDPSVTSSACLRYHHADELEYQILGSEFDLLPQTYDALAQTTSLYSQRQCIRHGLQRHHEIHVRN